MKTFDGRFYVCENTNVKYVEPNDGITTNFKMFNKRIFLAGPITGAPNWQVDMACELIKLNQNDLHSTLICNPRRKTYDSFDFGYQVHWDQIHLQNCNIVLFYIPPATDTNIGDGYAKTTMYELAEMVHTSKYRPDVRIIIAMYPEHPMFEYVKERILNMENIDKKNIVFLNGGSFGLEYLKKIAKIVME